MNTVMNLVVLAPRILLVTYVALVIIKVYRHCGGRISSVFGSTFDGSD